MPSQPRNKLSASSVPFIINPSFARTTSLPLYGPDDDDIRRYHCTNFFRLFRVENSSVKNTMPQLPQPTLPEPAHPDLDSMLSRKFGKEVANYFSGIALQPNLHGKITTTNTE